MLANINSYDKKTFLHEFSNTEIYSKLKEDFDILVFDYHGIPDCFGLGSNSEMTPRQYFGTSMFSCVPFYYLNYLTKHNPQVIYDLGCGWNIFKKYIPNIIGIGAEEAGDKFYGDICDIVDADYVANHQNTFESVFSINALHFRPLSELRKIVSEFSSMISSGGRGFLTLNLQRMIDLDPQKYEYETYIRSELDNFIFVYEVFDVELSTIDSYMDGNIRMVIHKP